MEKHKHQSSHHADQVSNSLIRHLDQKTKVKTTKRANSLKVAFIHNEKKIATGAHHINQLMTDALSEKGVKTKNFFPKRQLSETPTHLKGIANILFFHSLLEHKEEILKNHIIQGTTYTPLPFLSFNVPIVCHFGSTMRGYLDMVPDTRDLPEEERNVFKGLANLDIIPEFDMKTFRPLEDVADIEALVATQANACVATSKKVKEELIRMNVPEERVHMIHNVIEDYWFLTSRPEKIQPPHLVFLGRLGSDVFTLKLKGFSRLVNFYRRFPDVPKTTLCMTSNRKLKEWLRVSFPNHYTYTNLRKDLIPGALAPLFGSIQFLSSRYEGFSLSLVEGMSQGLVPISYPVGVAPEIIENGVNGYLVNSQTEAYERAAQLLGNDEMRLSMAAKAQNTTEQFRSHNISAKLYNLYQSIRDEGRESFIKSKDTLQK